MEIIGEYGGIVGGGDLTPQFIYGIPYETWLGFTETEKQQFLVDYYRGTAPFQVANLYQYTEPPLAHDIILAGQQGYDYLTDEAWETTKDVFEYGQEKISDLVTYAGILGIIYVATRK